MHPRVCIDSIAFMSDSLATQSEYFRRLGASKVTLLGHHIAQEGTVAARAALEHAGCQLQTVVHPFLPGQALKPSAASWEAPREALAKSIDAVAELGGKSLYMITGGHGGMIWEEAAEVFCQAISPCIGHAAQRGVTLMIENAPPLYADIHIAHSLRDTITLARQAGIGVCIDLPGCWTEAGLQDLIREAVPITHLVQVSDYVCGDRCVPARAVPGDGNMPLERMIGWLLDAGYTGLFDLELIGPRIDEEGGFAATQRSAESLSALLEKLGA